MKHGHARHIKWTEDILRASKEPLTIRHISDRMHSDGRKWFPTIHGFSNLMGKNTQFIIVDYTTKNGQSIPRWGLKGEEYE